MFQREIIELSDCPDFLQEKVIDYMQDRRGIEILSVQKEISTPYKDKTIIDTTYSVYTLQSNYFCIHSTSVSSKPEWNFNMIDKRCMLAGEISQILKLRPEWFNN